MSCTGKSREKWLAGAAVLICGLVTHGYILTNKISYHDDSVNYFGVGTTFESGRWALGLIQKFLTKIDFLTIVVPGGMDYSVFYLLQYVQ